MMFLAARAAAEKIDVSPAVLAYIVDLVQATRQSSSLRLGVSPRGATALLRTSRVWAFLQGRSYVTPDDVKTMAISTLAHRVSLRAEADLEGISPLGLPSKVSSRLFRSHANGTVVACRPCRRAGASPDNSFPLADNRVGVAPVRRSHQPD